MKGWVRSIRTVSAATAVQPLKMERRLRSAWALKTPLNVVPGACCRSVSGKLNQRLKLLQTAAASKAVPSWKVTCSRSLKV